MAGSLRLVLSLRPFQHVTLRSFQTVRHSSSSSSLTNPTPSSSSTQQQISMSQIKSESASNSETHTYEKVSHLDADVEVDEDVVVSDAAPQPDHPLFRPQSKRRILASPTLPLEALSLSHSIQQTLKTFTKSHHMRSRDFTDAYSHLHESRARETYRFVGQRTEKKGGRPVVTPPPLPYTKPHVAAYAANRFPGSFAACVHVLTEVRRILPGTDWNPSSVLDFGSGIGTGLLAVTRVFTCPSISEHCSLMLGEDGRVLIPNDGDDNKKIPHMPVNHAWLIDHSPAMLELGREVMKEDSHVQEFVKDMMMTKSLSEGPPKSRRYDAVIASYSLAEVVKDTMASGLVTSEQNEQNKKEENEMDVYEEEMDRKRRRKVLTPMARERAAEIRIKKMVRALWRRTKPGGVLVIIEDGTAAGFETVLFARELLLSKYGRRNPKLNNKINVINSESNTMSPEEGADNIIGEEEGDDNESEDLISKSEMEGENVRARVIAPCIHSKKCPLDGSITRHRICRFVQRLNRPPLQRELFPRHNAFEDEYFSYIAIQKVTVDGDEIEKDNDDDDDDDIHGDQWGRLIRVPLRRTKHIAMDACTRDANLERRVITKINAASGDFPLARRSKWGDIWPRSPSSKSSKVNF